VEERHVWEGEIMEIVALTTAYDFTRCTIHRFAYPQSAFYLKHKTLAGCFRREKRETTCPR